MLGLWPVPATFEITDEAFGHLEQTPREIACPFGGFFREVAAFNAVGEQILRLHGRRKRELHESREISRTEPAESLRDIAGCRRHGVPNLVAKFEIVRGGSCFS